jgi:hypothetical protein
VFLCPVKQVAVCTGDKPMTVEQFTRWQKRLITSEAIECAECDRVHVLIAEDFLLEDEPLGPR